MRFYNNQHQYYAGIDLHARKMYICIIDGQGKILFHKNMDTNPTNLAKSLEPYLPDIIVGVECVFTWYWISDFCEDHNIPFILGHALYMKAIHGGKTKNDKIDSSKIASLIRGGMFPLAYVYPREMRTARDLLRRRQHFVHLKSELISHITNTNTQFNMPIFEKNITHPSNRIGISDRFEDDLTIMNIDMDIKILESCHRVIRDIETAIKKHATNHDPKSLYFLRTIPGIGPTLALIILYEINDINRFEGVGNFISYSRLVKCSHESAGKRMKGGNNKIGNPHLKWAFSEASVCFLRGNEQGKKLCQRLTSRYGKAKALSLIAQKLGRTAYYMLKRHEPFLPERFYQDNVHEPVV
jgi:transposase